jgi:hypothetical protein
VVVPVRHVDDEVDVDDVVVGADGLAMALVELVDEVIVDDKEVNRVVEEDDGVDDVSR